MTSPAYIRESQDVFPLSKSQHLGARSVSCEPWGEIEGGATGSPARWMMVNGESQTARHARFVSADLDLSQDRPPAITGVRDLRRDRSLPHSCDASRARPSRAGIGNDIAQLRRSVKNKRRTLLFVCPASTRHGRTCCGYPHLQWRQRRGSPEQVRG